MNIIWKGSPNYGKTRFGNNVEFIVVHWIVGTLQSADAVFANPNNQVSAHYGVGNGIIHQYVKESDTAWHAGNQTANRKSIGIEHQGSPTMPITDATYNTSADLIADICRRYGKRFPLRPHNDFVRTACPGTLDLNRLNKLVDQRLNTNQQGDDMITANDRDPIRVISSEVKGWDFDQVHKGTWDSREVSAWTGRRWHDFIMQGWNEGASFRAARNQKMRDYDVLVKQLAESKTKAEYEAVAAQAKVSADRVAELEKKIAEEQANETEAEAIVQQGQSWLQKLLNWRKK